MIYRFADPLKSLLLLVGLLVSSVSQADGLVIQNVRVWDGVTDEVSSATSVRIEGKLISEVSELAIAPGADDKVIDGKGGFLMPGLIDMHTHIALKYGKPDPRDGLDNLAVGAMATETLHEYLDRGYTTLRDIGGNSLSIARLLKQGRLQGPRLYSSGAVISGTSGHGDWNTITAGYRETGSAERDGHSILVSGRDEAIDAVRTNLRGGASQIKVMVSGGMASEFDPITSLGLTEEELRATVEAAADYGTYVCGHAYDTVAVNRAIDAGLKCIEHGLLMDEPTVKRMAKEKIWLSLQAWAGTIAIADPEMISYFTPAQKKKAAEVYRGAVKVMELAARYDVPVYAGTDMYFHTFLPRVTEDLVARLPWFSPVEILRQNTSYAGKALAQTTLMNPYPEGALGVIAPGAYADLLIVDGNPLENLEVLLDKDNLHLIMKDGVIHKAVE